jgi:transcriptional regulator with XRE-family HTH domain
MIIKHAIKILTPTFCRGARALLNMSQKELAEASGLSQQTIADFERGARTPHPNNLKAVVNAFSDKGISLEYEKDDIVGIRVTRQKQDAPRRTKASKRQP